MRHSPAQQYANKSEQALASRFLPPLSGNARRKVPSAAAPYSQNYTFLSSRKGGTHAGPRFPLIVKRAIDVLCAGAGLICAAPLMAAIAVMIKLDSPGPLLYCAPRAGKKGRSFICYKFRTMVAKADHVKKTLRSHNDRNGPFFKLEHDPRITRVGKLLRRYSLDEIPQLWNVLRGEMSLVGPRPHPLDDCQLYVPRDWRRLEVTPGMTGLWQVTARKNPSFQLNMSLDLEYIERWNLAMDLRILYKTIFAVIQGTGA